MINLKKLTGILPLLLFWNYIYAQEVISLQDAMKIALEANYGIIISKDAKQIAELNNTYGNAGFLPQVAITGSVNRSTNNTRQEFFSGDLREKQGAASSSIQGAIELNWTVFDGFGMFVRKERLNTLEELSDIQLRAEIESVLSFVAEQYLQAVFLQQRIMVLDSIVEFSQDRKKLMEDMYGLGAIAGIDVTKAGVDLNFDISSRLREIARLNIIKGNLNSIMGKEPSFQFSVNADGIVNTELKYEEVLKKALEENPAIVLARKNIYLESLDVKEINSGFLPRVNLNAGYNAVTSQSEVGILKSNQNVGYFYGASISWNIFNGFNGINQRKIALIEANSATHREESLKRDITNQIYSAYMEYISAKTIYLLEEKNLISAKEVAYVSMERHKLGEISALELRESLLSLQEAGFRLSEAKYMISVAEVKLLHYSSSLQAQ